MNFRDKNIELLACAWLFLAGTVAFAEDPSSGMDCNIVPGQLNEAAREIGAAEAAARSRLGLPSVITFSSAAKQAYKMDCQTKSKAGIEVEQKQSSSVSSQPVDLVQITTNKFVPSVLNSPKLLGHIAKLVPKFRTDNAVSLRAPAVRRSSPRPLLRPQGFDVSEHKSFAELTLENILNEVSETEELLAKNQEQQKSPPLTGREIEVFRDAVGKCWSVDLGSKAKDVTVTLTMEMRPNGKVLPTSIELVKYTGGSDSVANKAFQQARRAILRCQKDGYDLPANKYEQWRNVEITFDPDLMKKR